MKVPEAVLERSSRLSRKLEIRKSSLADFTPASKVKMAAATIRDEEGNLQISSRGGKRRRRGKVAGASSETVSKQERGEVADCPAKSLVLVC